MIEETKIELIDQPAQEAPKRRVRRAKKGALVKADAPEKPKRGRRAKKEKAPEAEPVQYHRINSIPRGYRLTYYTVAVLDAIGMYTPHRKAVEQDMLTQFYNTDKIISWHLGNNNLERTRDGKIRLTADGRSHFVGLTEGNPFYEKKVKPEIDAMREGILNGGGGFSEVPMRG